MKYQVGVIGYGPFAAAMERWLEPYCEFVNFNRRQFPEHLTEALAQPIVVLSIPAQFLDGFLEQHQALLNPNALYIDVCSVKVAPVAAMLARLPATAQIIATHPIFGPESGKNGIAGLPIMVNNVRTQAETYETFLALLRTLELHIIESTPEEHDQEMAYVQGLTHYIGRAMQRLNVSDTPYATGAYHALLQMKDIQGNDSDDLFYSIVHHNPYTKQVLKDFNAAQKDIDAQFDLPSS